MTALGMIETIGLVSALEAADAGLKAAAVRLLGTDYVRGGLVMVRFSGEVAAVQAAVDAGAQAAQRIGKVFSAHVIARAMPEVVSMLLDQGDCPHAENSGCASCGACEGAKREAKEHKAPAISPHYEDWTVLKLRQHVRELPGFPLSPNEIRFARKDELLSALAIWKAQRNT